MTDTTTPPDDQPCVYCEGSGRDHDYGICRDCGGSGRAPVAAALPPDAEDERAVDLGELERIATLRLFSGAHTDRLSVPVSTLKTIFRSLPWLLAQAREAERLRAELAELKAAAGAQR